jgi:hypothetical protein
MRPGIEPRPARALWRSVAAVLVAWCGSVPVRASARRRRHGAFAFCWFVERRAG